MDTQSQNLSTSRYGRFLSLIMGTDLFFRELIIAFYGLFVVVFLAFNVWDNHPAVILAYQCACAFCAPGIIFATGWLIAGSDYRRKESRPVLLGYAAICYIYYVISGAALHVLAYGEECLKTIKNILFAVLIPGDGGIFLTCALLFLLFAMFGDRLAVICGSRRWIIGLCIAGFLTTFIPAEMIGYGIFGLFAGSDTAGAVPVFYYLIALFWGMRCRGEQSVSLKERDNLILTVLLLIAGAVFQLTGCSRPASVALGTGLAFIGINLLMLLQPVYRFLEEVFLKIFRPLNAWYHREAERTVPGTRRYILWYYAGYLILFAVVTFFIFVPYINGGYSLIWESDGLGQYLPKAFRFVKDMPGVVSALLHGDMNFKQYDFSVGLGSPMTYSFDPVYWLYLAAGEKHVEWMYNFAVILRYLLAGLSMSALMLSLRKSWRMAAIGSLAYTYSSYAIFAGTRHSQFITPLILFPLIVIAMERLIRTRKWYMMTVLVAISLFCSYYFLYMNTIAIGIYFLLRILLTKEYRNLRTFFDRGLIITGSYVLGTSIAFLSLVTSFGGYLGSSRSGGSAVSTLITNNTLFYRSEWLIDVAAGLIAVDFGPGQWLKIGMAPAILFTLVLLYTRKNRSELRWAFIICLIFSIFPIFGYIMSGFSSVTNRWSYIFTAVLAIILALNMDRLTNLTKREISIFAGIAGGYGLLMFIGLKFHTTGIQGCLALLAFTIALIFLLNLEKDRLKPKTARLILFWFILFTVVMGNNFYITRVGTLTGDAHLETYIPAGQALGILRATGLKYLNKVEGFDKEEFVRSDNLRNVTSTRNSSMVVPYNSVSTFTSTLPGGIVDYNRAMGNNAWNIVTIYDYNFRTYMNELASVRYLGRKSTMKATLPYGYRKVYETTTSANTYQIYENEYALPAGYTYDKVVPASALESLDALSRQEISMTAAIVDDKDFHRVRNLERPDHPESVVTTEDVPIKNIKTSPGITLDETGLLTIEDMEDARLTFDFESLPDSETYLVIKGEVVPVDDSREIEISTECEADGVKYTARFRLDNYSTGQDEYVYNLGYHKKPIKKCTLDFTDKGQLQIESFRICSLPMGTYGDRVNALKEESLTHVRQKTNELTGEIEVSKDKLLVITLPYQNGWTAYVDGKKADISQVDYQFMGLPLTKGKHEIRMVYRIPGLRYGFLISGLGIAVFALIIIGNALRKRIARTKTA